MKNTRPLKALIIVLSVHIFSVQSKLLFLLNAGAHEFSYLTLDEKTILSMVFALSYASATAIIIWLSKDKRLIYSYAVLDGASMLLYYFALIPISVSAFYFAFYTFWLIKSITDIQEHKTIEQRALELKKTGLKQNHIARVLNMTEYQLKKILDKSIVKTKK